jgi:molybdopterin-guanine dinucleotide biosynthesis protein A
MLTVAVQAGGQSSRMGEDKALKLFLGRPLIERVIERLTPIADEMIVTTNRPAEYGFLKDIRLITDLKPGRGALGGLYTAVASAAHPFVAVVACDMPFASANFFESASSLMVGSEADVIIVKTEQGYEPLHALYRRETCLPAIEAAIDADQWKVTSWFSQVKVHEVKDFDPVCFWNLNTTEEFAKAEDKVRSGAKPPNKHKHNKK